MLVMYTILHQSWFTQTIILVQFSARSLGLTSKISQRHEGVENSAGLTAKRFNEGPLNEYLCFS